MWKLVSSAKNRPKNIVQRNVCINTEKQAGKKARNILIRKEQGLPFVPFAVKSLGQYTNTKTGNLFIVQKNVGLKEGKEKEL